MSVAELSWCHWWGFWLQTAHHRRCGDRNWSRYGKCTICDSMYSIISQTSMSAAFRINTAQMWVDTYICTSHIPLSYRCLGWSLACSCAARSGNHERWCDTFHQTQQSLLMLHDVIPRVADSPLPIKTLLDWEGWPKQGWVQIFLIVALFVSSNCTVDTKAHLSGLDRCDLIIGPTIAWVSSVLQW